MRTTVAKVVLVAVFIVASVAFVAAPARADGGSPFQPGDNRINPLTGDKLAVYCNPSTVDVLGLNQDNNGFFLTTFSMAELSSAKPTTHKTANGNVTLTLDQAPTSHIGFQNFDQTTPTLIWDTSAAYHITWTGGSFGADGSQPFVKTFACAYEFTPTSVATTK